MTTSTSSLTSTTAPVMLSSETAVTFHTSSGTFLETTPQPDAQMMVLQQMFGFLASSDEMVIAESDRTRAAAQRAYDKLLQDFQRVSQENDTLRMQTVQVTGQLNQLTTVHETATNALNGQVRLADQRAQAMQQGRDKAIRRCRKNVAAATRETLEAVQAAQNAARTQTENLERSHRAQMEAQTGTHASQIATLNQSHQRTISQLQDQLNEARSNHQTAVAVIAQKDQLVQSLTTNVQNLTATLNQTQGQMQSLQNQLTQITSNPVVKRFLGLR